MMNENDFGSEKVLRAINHLYMMQVCICIAALKELRSAELTDKNIILRAIMRDMPDCGICADLTAEDYGVDFWADRAEYVNESTFNLYVTQAEENVLWNIEKKGQKPGRLAVPLNTVTQLHSIEEFNAETAPGAGRRIRPPRRCRANRLPVSIGSRTARPDYKGPAFQTGFISCG